MASLRGPTELPPVGRRSPGTQPPQLALDHAPVRAKIEMAPALDPPVMDRPAELAAARANPPTATKPHSHDHPLRAEADIADRRAR